MTKKLTAFILISYFFLTPFSTAQEDGAIAGELIIQLKAPAPIESFIKSYADIELENIRLLSQRLNIWWMKFNSEENDALEVRFRISRDPMVQIVQFNHQVELRESFGEFAGQFANFPDDPQFGSQWGLHNTGQSGGTPDADIDAPEAWDITTGGVTVSGIQ